eukprot:9475167-Pyramimonas_sp.AAC.2
MDVRDVLAAIIVFALSLEATVNEFQRKFAYWFSIGVPHPRCATLKRKRADDLGEELLAYNRYWNGLYRLSRHSFDDLLTRIGPCLKKQFQKQVNASGAAVPPKMMLSMTLCYLGGGRV